MKDAAARESTAERLMVGSWSLDERRQHLPKVAPHGALRQERARAADRAEADDTELAGRTGRKLAENGAAVKEKGGSGCSRPL